MKLSKIFVVVCINKSPRSTLYAFGIAPATSHDEHFPQANSSLSTLFIGRWIHTLIPFLVLRKFVLVI
jgi:hypothetical protein